MLSSAHKVASLCLLTVAISAGVSCSPSFSLQLAENISIGLSSRLVFVSVAEVTHAQARDCCGYWCFGGVGRAPVREFARHSASIGVIARGREGLDGARREVEALGGKALVLPLDVADPEQVEDAAAQVERRLGPIDIWVNNTMTSVFSPIEEMMAEEFKRVTEVTYLGYVYGRLAALKRMPRDRGTIVHVGSPLAYRSIPLQGACCAREAGSARILCCAPHRTSSRPQQCAHHHGSDARAEYAAARLGEEPLAAKSLARAADLSTGTCGSRYLPCCSPP